MSPDVRHLLQSLRVPGFRYRDFGARLSPARDAHRRRERSGLTIIALVSLVRAAGKTTLAANLARTLAARGLRAAAFDLDPKGELALHFRSRARRGIPFTDGIAAWMDGGEGFVPYGREAGAAIEPLAAECDALLFDTPSEPSPQLEQVLGEADEVLVVLRADAASLASVRPTEDLLARCRKAWHRTRARYVVNQFDARRSADRQALSALRGVLGTRVLSRVVQQDEAVRTALAAGDAIGGAAPDSQVIADLEVIAEDLVPRRAGARE